MVEKLSVRGPHRVVGEVLLHVREAGHRPAFGQRLAVAQTRVAQHGDAVAERAGDLPALVELDERAVQVDGLLEGEHRRLASGS